MTWQRANVTLVRVVSYSSVSCGLISYQCDLPASKHRDPCIGCEGNLCVLNKYNQGLDFISFPTKLVAIQSIIIMLIVLSCLYWNHAVIYTNILQAYFTATGDILASPKFRQINLETWWRHQMETFSALLALCAGKSPVSGEFPSQRPLTRSFDDFLDLRLNKRLSKQSWGWWLDVSVMNMGEYQTTTAFELFAHFLGSIIPCWFNPSFTRSLSTWWYLTYWSLIHFGTLSYDLENWVYWPLTLNSFELFRLRIL